MSESGFFEALKPLRASMPKVVREHEVMRIAGHVEDRAPAACAESLRQEVLKWAERHCGGHLPRDAWGSESFEYFSGGRNSYGIRINSPVSDIWAIRAEDPDKNVPGRTWTNEVVVGVAPGRGARFSVRQLVSTSEEFLDIDPHSPGFVQQISDGFKLLVGDRRINKEPWLVDSACEADLLIEYLLDSRRRLPVFVLSAPDGAIAPMLDADVLARATLGTAQVVVLLPEFTWSLTNRFGKLRSVFGGAIRAYLPDFSEDANPYSHRLTLAEMLYTEDGKAQNMRWMRSLAASESIRRIFLGREVLAFGEIRNASLKLEQYKLEHEGASESVLLETARTRIKALEIQVEEQKSSLEYFDSEHKKAEERAEVAEDQARASVFRIQRLIEQIKSQGDTADNSTELPESWSIFANWCDTYLIGRVALTPIARRSVRSPAFADVETAARCLRWLATECRDALMNGGGRGLERVIEQGIRNAHCGADEFDLLWQGQRHTADWHVKNGGNTRDPRRCLRIYYFWDATTMQIVIAEMPAHRRTDAT